MGAGNEIQNIADKIQQQNGINECLGDELDDVGEITKKLFEKTLEEIL